MHLFSFLQRLKWKEHSLCHSYLSMNIKLLLAVYSKNEMHVLKVQKGLSCSVKALSQSTCSSLFTIYFILAQVFILY